MPRVLHGLQQSDVCVQPLAKNGTQVSATHVPVASGLLCSQTNPGAQVGGGTSTFPPHGPPSPETHPHDTVPLLPLSQVAPAGQVPSHIPLASTPHGRAQRAAGPGQQLVTPVASRHRHACSQVSSMQRSAVHGLPSSHSVSIVQPGSVVVVVLVARHAGEQISFGLVHGWPGPQGSSLHWPSTVMKHLPSPDAD
jgi:hypothetical protein